jgi:hypothetical protein
MHLDITVPYQNAVACYAILKEAEGIYLAVLQHYEGAAEQAPPERVVLIKGIRKWTGSFDQPELIQKIGKAIEAANISTPSRKSKPA